MLTLGIDSSATAASAALIEDGRVLAESYVNIRQTHSQTLLPMIQEVLQRVGRACRDLDLVAVSHGPGSFTGIRIGIATAKGIALTNETPCAGVSTLETIAYGGRICEGACLCAVMDARCGQVYNGLFRVENGELRRLTEDRALAVPALEQECRKYGDHLILLGDGAEVCYKTFCAWGARLAPEPMRLQRASSVALLGACQSSRDTADSLAPVYLRLPQAERELKKRMEQKGVLA